MKIPIALKVLVWSRGQLVTLQILAICSFSLVEETDDSSGQCVTFPLIDFGSGIVVFSCLFKQGKPQPRSYINNWYHIICLLS